MSRIQTINFARPRSLVLILLWGMLLLSVGFSMASKYGHADTPIAATAAETKPLQAGERAPSFVVRAVDGERVEFDPDNLQRPVVVITFRGGWCPFCNMHLSELRHVIPEISEAGVDVMFLSGDRPDQLYKSLSDDTQEDIAGLGYTIYSDADASAAIAFGIAFRTADSTIDRRKEKGQDIDGSSMTNHGVLPVPAVFAIRSDGEIAFAYANPDYKVRVPADELLVIAREIATP